MKKGEEEARIILQSLGFKFSETYHDDGSKDNMPDFMYEDGRFLEVTHTNHNNKLYGNVTKYFKHKKGETPSEWLRRHAEMEEMSNETFDRVRSCNYEHDDKGHLTQKANEQYKKDCHFLKNHLGYDYSKQEFSEFNCDAPIISFSSDNIIREVINDKGEKYKDLVGNIDLFIFVAEEEFKIVKKLLTQYEWNGASQEFLNKLLNSVFMRIFVCEWNLPEQKYNTDNPPMIMFYKEEKTLGWHIYNI